MFARVRHCLPSSAKWIQHTFLHPICLICILLLSSHLRLSPPGSLFIPSGFQTKALYAIITFHIRVTWPADLIHLYFIILLISGEKHELLCNIRLNYVLVISFHASGRVCLKLVAFQFLEVIGRIQNISYSLRIIIRDVLSLLQDGIVPVTLLFTYVQ
jgi:hypothetical protein